MAKATSRIKTGKGKFIEVGQDVPDDVAKANPHAVETKLKTTIDPDKPESYAGEAAAQESIDARPDNPNRPRNVEGEAALKVTKPGSGATPIARGPAGTPPVGTTRDAKSGGDSQKTSS